MKPALLLILPALLLASCQSGSQPNPADGSFDPRATVGAWSGRATGGHRVTLQVTTAPDGKSPCLAGAPVWKLRQTFGERLFEKMIGDIFSDVFSNLTPVFEGWNPSASEADIKSEPVQKWNATSQTLTYQREDYFKSSRPDQFASGYDYHSAWQYVVHFQSTKEANLVLDDKASILLKRRR